MGLPKMLQARSRRAAILTFWRGVSPDAQRLMLATMILSSLALGVENVARTLFVLRLDLGTEFFGTFNSFRAFGFMGMAVPAGMLSRRIGLRNTMLLGSVLFLAGYVGGSLVEILPHAHWKVSALATNLMSTGGFAMYSVNASPAIMSTTRPHNRSRIYGAASAARNFGTLAGMLVGGILPAYLSRTLNLSLAATGPYQLALLACAVIAIPGIYVISRFREDGQPQMQPRIRRKGDFPIVPMVLILVYVLFSQGASTVCRSFCNAYMDTQLRLGPDTIGILGALAQLSAALVPFAIPRLSRHLHRGNLLAVTSLALALMLLPLSYIRTWAGAGLGRLGVMSLAAIWMPVVQIYQMEMVQREWRPLASGLMSVAQSLNYGTLSFFGGRVISLWGYPPLFMIGAVLTVVGSFMIFLVSRLPLMQPQHAN